MLGGLILSIFVALGWFLEAAFLAAGIIIAPIPTYTVLSHCLITAISLYKYGNYIYCKSVSWNVTRNSVIGCTSLLKLALFPQHKASKYELEYYQDLQPF